MAKVQVILIALVVAMTGCRHKEEQQLPIVIVDKPSKEDVQIYGEYVGRIRAASFVGTCPCGGIPRENVV